MRGVYFILIVFIVGTTAAFGQYRLTIEVEGVSGTTGAIAIALYDNPKSFLDFEKAHKFARIKAAELHQYSFEDLKAGTYAVAVFYDENSNNKLDTNFIGIPKEALGTSGSPKNRMGPPRYKNCMFVLNEDQLLTVEVKKLFK